MKYLYLIPVSMLFFSSALAMDKQPDTMPMEKLTPSFKPDTAPMAELTPSYKPDTVPMAQLTPAKKIETAPTASLAQEKKVHSYADVATAVAAAAGSQEK